MPYFLAAAHYKLDVSQQRHPGAVAEYQYSVATRIECGRHCLRHACSCFNVYFVEDDPAEGMRCEILMEYAQTELTPELNWSVYKQQ